MKNNLRHLFFRNDDDSNIGLLFLRIFFGIGLIIHGFPKLFFGLDQFAGYIGSLGIPFPGLMAFLAAAAEFIGGLFLVFGLLTSFSAVFVAINMIVAVFVVHLSDPFLKKELALLYLLIATLYIFKGAGKYSIDHFIDFKR